MRRVLRGLMVGFERLPGAKTCIFQNSFLNEASTPTDAGIPDPFADSR